MPRPVIILDTVEAKFGIFDIGGDVPLVQTLEFQSLAANSSAAIIWHAPCIRFRTDSHMFRISTIDTDRERRLIVEGTLVQPWVSELRRTWHDAGSSLGGRKLVLDLTNAIMIDAEGESAIFDLMQEGAKFCCRGVLTRHLLKQLALRCHTSLRHVLNQPVSHGGRCSQKEKT